MSEKSNFEKDNLFFRNLTLIVGFLLILYFHCLLYYGILFGYVPPPYIVLFGRSLYAVILIFYHMLALRVTIGWFPNINVYREPLINLVRVTDPYLTFWRGFIPNIFGFDISPWLGFIILEVLLYTFEESSFLYRLIYN